jgi:DNA-binding transcriptional regulator YdaS (Cro superfamily)
MTEQEVRERLRDAIAELGGQRAFAEKHKFSTAYVSDVVRGRRELSERILRAIAIERVISYREVVGSVVSSTPRDTE